MRNATEVLAAGNRVFATQVGGRGIEFFKGQWRSKVCNHTALLGSLQQHLHLLVHSPGL